MDVVEDCKIFKNPDDIIKLTKIKRAIVEKVADVNVEFTVAKEPIPFANRADKLERMRKGQKWGGLFDCAWFHITADIPDCLDGRPLCLVVDIGAEGLIVDEENNALQGIANPVNIGNIADYFNLTHGKTLYHLPAGTAKKLDIWMEGGFNGILGKDIGSGKLRRAELAYFNPNIASLYFEYLTLAFAKVTYKGKTKSETTAAMNKCYRLFNKGDIEGARAALKSAPKNSADSDLTVTAVGHSHLDLAWLWPLRETKRKAARTLSTALKNMDLYPDFIYGASQPQEFEWIKERYPATYKKLQERAAEGRFEPQGGMWVECDTNLTGAESLVRQFLYGKEFWKKEFNADLKNCWLPDVFGYSAALPQIMKKCGVDYFMTQKLSWNEHNEFPYQTFTWEGLSEDKVLTHLLPGNTYNSSGAAPSLAELYRTHKRKDTLPEALMLYGAGDGGGGPCEANIELLKNAENLCGLPKIKLGRADEFFERISKYTGAVPNYKGELYLEKHQGTYTTQSNNKKLNRKCEFALHDLEALAALAIRMGYDYPHEKIKDVWKEVLLYQFHDILPGSAIGRVYTESVARYKQLLTIVEGEREKIIEFLSAGDGLSAINTAPYARKEYIKKDGKWYLFDAAPYSGEELSLVSRTPSGLNAADGVIENDKLKVKFDKNGEIISLIDKETKTEFNGAYLNRLSVYHDKKLFYNAWDIDIDYTKKPHSTFKLTSTKTYVDGCRVVAENHYRYGKSKLFQRVILGAGKPYVEFDTRVEWHETHKMLRADFIPSHYSDKVTCDVQFGNISRSTRTDNKIDWAQFEIPAHKFIDVSDDVCGGAILSSSKYGFRAKDGLMSINLLRSPVYPDKLADRGNHHFRYAYYPHKGGCFDAEVTKWAYLMNYAPLTVQHALNVPSLVSVDKRNITVETIKPSEDGKGTVVRLFENEGKTTTAKLSIKLSYSEIYLADMLENPLQQVSDDLEFKPYEIKTLLLK